MLTVAVAFARDFIAFAGRRGIAAAALTLAAGLTEAGGLALVAPLLAVAAGAPGGWPGRVAEHLFQSLAIVTPLGRLAVLLAALAGLWAARAVAVWSRDAVLSSLQVGFSEAQRARVAGALANAPWARVAALRHARVTHALGQDVLRIGQAAHVMIQASVAVVMLASQAAIMLSLAPAVAAMALTLMAVGGLALGALLRRAHTLGGEVTRANLDLADAAGRFLGGMKLAASQNLQGPFVERFEADLVAVRHRQTAFLRQQSAARLAVSGVALGAAAAVALVSFGWLGTPLPLLAAIILILTRMAGPAAQIQQALQQLAHTLPAYAQVTTLAAELGLQAPEVSPPAPTGIDWNAPITFQNVTFFHPPRDGTNEGGELSGIEDVSFLLSPGEMLGLTGPSGAGKSTLADLLVGLIAPQAGEVRVGHVPLSSPVAAAWRARVSYVAQDPYLFHASVRENLAWSARSADEPALWEALEAAAAADMVTRLPQGLDTVVGERGALLSGGERQRLALARALLRDGNLLVLDEATSAIDIATERAILGRLRTRSGATLIIAHRAESLALCDRVLVLEKGRLCSGRGGIRAWSGDQIE